MRRDCRIDKHEGRHLPTCEKGRVMCMLQLTAEDALTRSIAMMSSLVEAGGTLVVTCKFTTLLAGTNSSDHDA